MTRSSIIGTEASASLPEGFTHPHASNEARLIAQGGLILRTQVGSGVHGTSISGQDDRDEMGICLEPPEFVTGLARVPNGIAGEGQSVRFEQYQRHTVWDKPGGLANRSGAGDLDVVIYSARKWARLALNGNPTVLLILFVPDDEVVFRNQAGAELVDNANRFVSRLAAERFLGYPQAQRAAMTGEVGAHQPSRVGGCTRLRHQVRHARSSPRPARRRAPDHRTHFVADSRTSSGVPTRHPTGRGSAG